MGDYYTRKAKAMKYAKTCVQNVIKGENSEVDVDGICEKIALDETMCVGEKLIKNYIADLANKHPAIEYDGTTIRRVEQELEQEA